MRETRACLICITHWSFEQIGRCAFPDLQDIIDAYNRLKGGKPMRRRSHPDSPEMTTDPEAAPDDLPPQLKQQINAEAQKEVRAAHSSAIHVSNLPLFLQKGIAEMRKKP